MSTIERIRRAKLKEPFCGDDLIRIGIHEKTARNFLPNHRKGSPGGYTVLFIRDERGLYRLSRAAR